MDPINPWIDPNETRRMAERLMRPSREPVVAPDETGFDDSFVGFSDLPDGVAEFATPEPTPADQEPDASPAGPPPPDAGNPSLFSEQRAMLRERFDAMASFMIDSRGALLFHEGGYESFHFLARESAKSGVKPTAIRIKVGATAILEIIPIESDVGTNWLGVVLRKVPPADSVGNIRLHWLAGQ